MRRTRTALYVPGKDVRPLRPALFAEMVEDFNKPRSRENLPELPPGVAQLGLRAGLNALGVRAPADDINVRYTYRVIPLMRRIPHHLHNLARNAVEDATSLEPWEAQRRMDAALAELYLAPGPLSAPARGECPWAYWSWDGEWLRCQWPPDKHPEDGIHADSSVPAIGKWHRLDMRAVNLEHWAS